jgi:hypothetical protein
VLQRFFHFALSYVLSLVLEAADSSPIRPFTRRRLLLLDDSRPLEQHGGSYTGAPISSLDPCHKEVDAHTPGGSPTNLA